jgi:hypothetical protein
MTDPVSQGRRDGGQTLGPHQSYEMIVVEQSFHGVRHKKESAASDGCAPNQLFLTLRFSLQGTDQSL